MTKQELIAQLEGMIAKAEADLEDIKFINGMEEALDLARQLDEEKVIVEIEAAIQGVRYNVSPCDPVNVVDFYFARPVGNDSSGIYLKSEPGKKLRKYIGKSVRLVILEGKP